MLRTPLQRLYERLGSRYPRVVLVLAFVLEFFVAGGGVLLLNLYVDISLDTFWRIALVSAVLVSLEVGAALWLGYRLLRRLEEEVAELGVVESAPKQDGRNMIMVIAPRPETKAAARRGVATKEREAAPDEEQAPGSEPGPVVGE